MHIYAIKLHKHITALIVTPILGYISMIVGAGFNPASNRTEHLNSKCEIQNAKFKKCGMNNHSSYLALIFLSFIKYI